VISLTDTRTIITKSNSVDSASIVIMFVVYSINEYMQAASMVCLKNIGAY